MSTAHLEAVQDRGETTQVEVSARLRQSLRRVQVILEEAPDGAPVELRHGNHRVEVPEEMRALVLAFTRAAASGAQSLLVSSDKLGHELTSQEVADVLNVSRPHVIKLARTGTLPFRKVGNRHRFRRADIVAYQRLEARRRGEVLARMVPDAGYGDGDF